MQKCISDYLDAVCASIGKESLRESVRGELADHLIERYREFENAGMDTEEAAQKIVGRMGDPRELGKRIVAANRSVYNIITMCIGTVLFILVLLFIFMMVGTVDMFIDISSGIFVLGISSAYGLLSCRGKPTIISFIRGVRSGAIYSGILCSVIALVGILYTMNEDLDGIGTKIAVSLISIIYGIILSMLARAAEIRLSTAVVVKELFE